MRAISVFNLEAGTSTFGWRAWIALRTRVSMSAMGSVIIFLLLRLLPAGLDHSGNFAVQGELPETQPADAELAQIAARPSAPPAAVPVPAPQLRLLGLAGLFQPQVFRNLRRRRHCLSSPIAGTAFPFAATAPALPHPSAPWW